MGAASIVSQIHSTMFPRRSSYRYHGSLLASAILHRAPGVVHKIFDAMIGSPTLMIFLPVFCPCVSLILLRLCVCIFTAVFALFRMRLFSAYIIAYCTIISRCVVAVLPPDLDLRSLAIKGFSGYVSHTHIVSIVAILEDLRLSSVHNERLHKYPKYFSPSSKAKA